MKRYCLVFELCYTNLVRVLPKKNSTEVRYLFLVYSKLICKCEEYLKMLNRNVSLHLISKSNKGLHTRGPRPKIRST